MLIGNPKKWVRIPCLHGSACGCAFQCSRIVRVVPNDLDVLLEPLICHQVAHILDKVGIEKVAKGQRHVPAPGNDMRSLAFLTQ